MLPCHRCSMTERGSPLMWVEAERCRQASASIDERDKGPAARAWTDFLRPRHQPPRFTRDLPREHSATHRQRPFHA